MIDDKNTEEVAAEVPVETQVEAAPVALNIQDLANIRHLLDVASQRGAFKPNEFQTVGLIYGKLSTFVDAAIAASQNAQAQAEAPAEAEATPQE